MYQDNIVFCGASSMSEIIYLTRILRLFLTVKQELQIMCVLFTEDAGDPDTGI